MPKPKKAFSDYDRPSVTVDLVLLTVIGRALAVLVIRRDEPPALGEWALPGGFVQIDESIEQAVQRVLRDKARLPDAFVEQLYTFGDPCRDPRGRVISVAHYALVDHELLSEALGASADLALATVVTPRAGEGGGPSSIRLESGESPVLPFDHADIHQGGPRPAPRRFAAFCAGLAQGHRYHPRRPYSGCAQKRIAGGKLLARRRHQRFVGA